MVERVWILVVFGLLCRSCYGGDVTVRLAQNGISISNVVLLADISLLDEPTKDVPRFRAPELGGDVAYNVGKYDAEVIAIVTNVTLVSITGLDHGDIHRRIDWYRVECSVLACSNGQFPYESFDFITCYFITDIVRQYAKGLSFHFGFEKQGDLYILRSHARSSPVYPYSMQNRKSYFRQVSKNWDINDKLFNGRGSGTRLDVSIYDSEYIVVLYAGGNPPLTSPSWEYSTGTRFEIFSFKTGELIWPFDDSWYEKNKEPVLNWNFGMKSVLDHLNAGK